MATKKKMLQAAAGNAGGAALNVEDVFSNYLYTGTGAAQTITNGIDLDGEGGLVWLKGRNLASNNTFVDTERGATQTIASNTSSQASVAQTVTAFNSDGFSIGTDGNASANNFDFTSWTFRKAPKFFDVVTYTGNGVAGLTVSHNLGVVPGCIIVKSTSGIASNWAVYHRSNTASPETDVLTLNTANATQDNNNYWHDTAPTATQFTVGGGETNGNGSTYVAYLFAHNDGDGNFGPDGNADAIKCGSYTGNGGVQDINLGFEAQWVLVKNTTSSNATASRWGIYDVMRGMPPTTYGAVELNANTSTAERTGFSSITPHANGFTLLNGVTMNNQSSNNYIYIAIRRPTAVPESATEVFAPNFYGTSGYVGYLGAPADMHMLGYRNGNSQNAIVSSRMIQSNKALVTSSRSAEITSSSSWDNMSGVTPVGTTLTTLISWTWKRASGFMDCVAYSGDGTTARAIPHNLGVPPQLMIHKRRNSTNDWYVPDFINSKLLFLNDPTAAINTAILANYYGSGNGSSGGAGSLVTPDASTFTVTPNINVNASGGTYIVYLFATLAGISKVGSATHSGTTNVDCGFTSGARFVLLKRTDASGDWYIWDSTRGIVSGNDPYLLLNSTAAEVTNTDLIDPLSSGFTITSSLTAGDYIFYAIA